MPDACLHLRHPFFCRLWMSSAAPMRMSPAHLTGGLVELVSGAARLRSSPPGRVDPVRGGSIWAEPDRFGFANSVWFA